MVENISGRSSNTHHGVIIGNYILEGSHTGINIKGNSDSTDIDGDYATQPRWLVIKDNYFFNQFHSSINLSIGARSMLVDGNYFERSGRGDNADFPAFSIYTSETGGYSIYLPSEGIFRNNIIMEGGIKDSRSGSANGGARIVADNRENDHKNERVYNNIFYNNYGMALGRGLYAELPHNMNATGHVHLNNIFYNNQNSTTTDDAVVYYQHSGSYPFKDENDDIDNSYFNDYWGYNSFEVSSENPFDGAGVGDPVSLATVESSGLGAYTGLTWENNTDGDPQFTDVGNLASILITSAEISTYNDTLSLSENRNRFSLSGGSPLIDQGRYLTLANGSGANSKTLLVDDAKFFAGGSNPANWDNIWQGDSINVGGVETQIASIDYTTNVLTLKDNISWSDNAEVSLVYSGSGMDIGLLDRTVEYSTSISDTTTTPPADTGGTWGSNLLTNGDFETGTTSNWTATGSPTLFEASSSEANSGTYSGHVTSSNINDGARTYGFDVASGDTVRVIVNLKRVSGTMYVHDLSNNIDFLQTYSSASSFTADTIQVIAGATGTDAIVFKNAYGGTFEWYFDDIEVNIKE